MGKQPSEKWFRRLLESNVLAIGSWHADGRFTVANDALLSLIGYTREEVNSGQVRWPDLTPPEYARLDAQALEEIRTKGQSAPFEKEIIRKDGSRIPVLVGAVAFGEGVTDAGAFYAVDLSERKDGRSRQSAEIPGAIRSLTDRQRVVCLLLSYGESEKRIAGILDVGLRTVELDKHHVAEKLGVPISRVVVWAVENRYGLVATIRDNSVVPEAIADIIGRIRQGAA